MSKWSVLSNAITAVCVCCRQDMLMQLAKAVANAAAALVLKAKNVAQKTEDSAQQNRVIAAATQCALSTSQLVACTRVSTRPEIYLLTVLL